MIQLKWFVSFCCDYHVCQMDNNKLIGRRSSASGTPTRVKQEGYKNIYYGSEDSI
jgi:hypothetical protein